MKKFCICFAGVPGCDKSPLAVRLSWELGLPVFSNDMIRREVRIENKGVLNITAYDKRRAIYLKRILDKSKSFIYDASVDRKWAEFKNKAKEEGYELFLISFDLSPEFVTNLGKSAGSLISNEAMRVYFKQHDDFLKSFGHEADIHITDVNFSDRFELCLKATAVLK